MQLLTTIWIHNNIGIGVLDTTDIPHSENICILIVFLNVIYLNGDILEVGSPRAINHSTVPVNRSTVPCPAELDGSTSWRAAHKTVMKEAAIEGSS